MISPHTLSFCCRLSHPIVLGTIIGVSLLGGIVPDLTAQQPDRIFASAARANNFSNDDLRNYAKSLMQIEPLRQSTLAEIRNVQGGPLPNLICNQPATMVGLKDAARSRFIEYCDQCKSIAARNGLSMDLFNAITESLRTDPSLKQKIRSYMY